MKEEVIRQRFKKVNKRLMEQLSPRQKEEAVEEFKAVYSEEMGKVMGRVNKLRRVQQNLEKSNIKIEEHTSQLSQQIRKKVDQHLKKSQKIREMRVKSSKQSEERWQQKVKKVNRQRKKQANLMVSISNRMQKQSEKFLEQRLSPKAYGGQSRPRYVVSQQDRVKTQPDDPMFISEELYYTRHRSPSIEREVELPVVDQSEIKEKVERHMSRKPSPPKERLNQHLMKSDQKWREKEGRNFQNAMAKIDKIMRSREKIRAKIQRNCQDIKQTRQQREEKHRGLMTQARKRRHLSEHGEQLKQQLKSQRSQENSTRYVNPLSSNVKLKHMQLLEASVRHRTDIFEDEQAKQRRGKFHRMVRQTVNLIKLQTLRSKV